MILLNQRILTSQIFLKLFDSFFHCRVPMIFCIVISTSRQMFRYLSPPISMTFVQEEENPLLISRPFRFVNGGIKVVEPSFSALFSHSMRDEFGNPSPILRPILLDKFLDGFILFQSPCLFGCFLHRLLRVTS